MTKWSHSNWSGKSKLDPRASARLRNWGGKPDTAEARNHCFAGLGTDHGYDGLPPDQVIANVQGVLQRWDIIRMQSMERKKRVAFHNQ